MKTKVRVFICFVFCLIFICTAYAQEKEDLLAKMRQEVPIFEHAKELDAYMPNDKMSVISLEVDVSEASQQELLDFYKNTMTGKGWELKDLKDYGKNGSVMELFKEDMGTLSVMTIMKKTEKTGKIPVTLNLTVP
jgi:hypothetical protein